MLIILFSLPKKASAYKITINSLLSSFFYAIYSSIRDRLFSFLVFLLYKDIHILNISSAAKKKMKIKELKDFILKKYYRKIRFTKENSYYSMKNRKKKDLLSFATKLTKLKIPDVSNAK